LSGTLHGAGGVGGYIAVRPSGGVGHFAVFDGNGNVTGLVDGSNGTVSARYEYGPFLEVIAMTGPMCKANPIRGGSKYTDDETDLVYFGYRYLKALAGRWLSGDPLGEAGGLNLHLFIGNNPIGSLDPFGLRGINATEDMNLRTVVNDFISGGGPNTYYFWPPHSLTERIQSHEYIAFLLGWYNSGAITYCYSHPAGSLSQNFTYNYTAPGSQYFADYLDWWGQNGEGAPFGDYGLNVLGSFRVTVKANVDCCKRSRSLWVQVYNRFSEQSLFRKPWDRDKFFDISVGLKNVDAYITFEKSGDF